MGSLAIVAQILPSPIICSNCTSNWAVAATNNGSVVECFTQLSLCWGVTVNISQDNFMHNLNWSARNTISYLKSCKVINPLFSSAQKVVRVRGAIDSVILSSWCT